MSRLLVSWGSVRRAHAAIVAGLVFLLICISVLNVNPSPNNYNNNNELQVSVEDHILAEAQLQTGTGAGALGGGNKDYGGSGGRIARKIINDKKYDAEPETDENGLQCPKLPTHGKVSIFVAYVTESYKNHYHVAQQTLYCYVNRTGYELLLVDLSTDTRVKQYCQHNQLFFLKHCAAALYLADTDWLVVLDADTAIVNPNRCLEEYIDPNFDIILYERFFNWEIASGNYIVKNTPFARKFLTAWADYQYEQHGGFTGADNGVLQIHLLRTILPQAKHEAKICDRIWRNATEYNSYMAYVTCCKVARGAKYEWDKVKIYRRAHGWVQDWFITGDRWCPSNFMFHGWKSNKIGEGGWNSPFERLPDDTDCEPGHRWPWRTENRISCDRVRQHISATEQGSAKGFPKEARLLPYLRHSDVGMCWPDC